MIVVDTEFTSLSFKGGLWQIGAVDLNNPENVSVLFCILSNIRKDFHIIIDVS